MSKALKHAFIRIVAHWPMPLTDAEAVMLALKVLA